MNRRWGTATRYRSGALALGVVAMAALIAPPAEASAPLAYSATVVGNPSSVTSAITAISENGWISGYEYDSAYTPTLLVGKANDIHRVTFPPGTNVGGGAHPNAAGQVAVSILDPDSSTYHLAILNPDGTMTEPPIDPAWSVEVAGLDDNGVVAAAINSDECGCQWKFALIDTTSGAVTVLDAAAVYVIDSRARANGWSVGTKLDLVASTVTTVAWQDNGVAHVIAPPADFGNPKAIQYQPLDVNAAGTTVGVASSSDGSAPVRGFVWRPNGQLTLLDLGTYDSGYATGVSASGLVSGAVWNQPVGVEGVKQAYNIAPAIWDGAVLHTYPENGCAAFLDINDHYDTVGAGIPGNGAVQATVFAPRRPRLTDALAIVLHRCDGATALPDPLSLLPAVPSP